MTLSTPLDPTGLSNDAGARSAERAIRSTQQAMNTALDGMTDSAEALKRDAVPLINRTADGASALAHRSIDAVRETAHQVRERARHASDITVNYVRAEPVKATLIAAATGAALMGVVVMLTRQRDRH